MFFLILLVAERCGSRAKSGHVCPILSGGFAGCEALCDEQPANVPVARDSQRCRGSEATSTTSYYIVLTIPTDFMIVVQKLAKNSFFSCILQQFGY